MDHGYGIYSGYAHLSIINVVAGQFIRRGQVIGLAGSTGRSSSPHLHFELRLNEMDRPDCVHQHVGSLNGTPRAIAFDRDGINPCRTRLAVFVGILRHRQRCCAALCAPVPVYQVKIRPAFV
ncbi:MAG UNVERIFIED_CONTAM: M23 family metallopeptidase [Anaerolineae bacterium]